MFVAWLACGFDIGVYRSKSCNRIIGQRLCSPTNVRDGHFPPGEVTGSILRDVFLDPAFTASGHGRRNSGWPIISSVPLASSQSLSINALKLSQQL
jgi:hypothetical protein